MEVLLQNKEVIGAVVQWGINFNFVNKEPVTTQSDIRNVLDMYEELKNFVERILLRIDYGIE